MYQVVEPSSEQQLADYYQFRWKMLRKPLDQPQGSEKDEYESHAIHRMILDDKNKPIAIGRLHVTSLEEGQIRYMAVATSYRCQGLGALIMVALEKEARNQGLRRLILNSREESLAFYQQCGYQVTGDAPTLFGSISLQQMKKNLSEVDLIIRDALWCKELQQTWHDEIPISQVMGIRIHQYTGDVFETRANLNANLNLHGTMFAGSIYSLATLTGWGLLYLWLKDQGIDGHIVLGDGQIHYHKPVTQQPGAVARLADIQGELAPLTAGNKVRFELKVDVKDDDKPVAEFIGHYVVIPKLNA